MGPSSYLLSLHCMAMAGTRGERGKERVPRLRSSLSRTPQAVLENEDRRRGITGFLGGELERVHVRKGESIYYLNKKE